jgi:hypothetical protein
VQRLIGRIRIGDLNKLYGYRYGGGRYEYVLPDDDAGREDLIVLLQHYGHTNPHKMPQIIKLRAPWMEVDEVVRTIEHVNTYPRQWRAETMGRLQRVSKTEWQHLDLRTIAPTDMITEERRQERRLRNRLRMRFRRRAERRKPRAEYLANSKSRTKPWLAAGISRAKWYRVTKQKAKADETSVCPVILTKMPRTHLSHNNKPTVSKEAVRANQSHGLLQPEVSCVETTKPTDPHAKHKLVAETGVCPIKIGKAPK